MPKDLIGSAIPSVPNDELDSTLPTKGKAKVDDKIPPSAGMGALPKLVFFGIIIGVVLMYLKSRKGPVEKSFA